MANSIVSNVRFSSANGRDRVHGWVYAPTEMEPVALVQLSHGMCEYIGRYRWFMEALCSMGFVVFGNDHIGHGESSAPEDYGYFADKQGARCLVTDLHRMSVIVRQRYPALPLILFGHSMGSFVARLYAARYGAELSGLILCGTGGPNPLASAGIALASMVAKTQGPRSRSQTLNDIAFGNYNKHFQPQHSNYDWLTRDEAVVRAYEADPRCTFCFTASGFRDLFTLVQEANSRRSMAALPKELPVLLISGDMDPVGGYGKGVQTVLDRLLQAGMKDVSMTLYPQARHELLNELNKEEVLADIRQWLLQKLEK